jgi:hypothetical protein
MAIGVKLYDHYRQLLQIEKAVGGWADAASLWATLIY